MRNCNINAKILQVKFKDPPPIVQFTGRIIKRKPRKRNRKFEAKASQPSKKSYVQNCTDNFMQHEPLEHQKPRKTWAHINVCDRDSRWDNAGQKKAAITKIHITNPNVTHKLRNLDVIRLHTNRNRAQGVFVSYFCAYTCSIGCPKNTSSRLHCASQAYD